MGDIRDGTDCGGFLLYKRKYRCIGKEARGFEQLKIASKSPAKTS